MFKLIYNLLRKLECVRLYQGANTKWEDNTPRNISSRQHIIWSVIIAVVTSFNIIIHPLLAILYVVAFHVYAPWMEDFFQYNKENKRPMYEVMAQKWEKWCGFIITFPFAIGIFIWGLL